MSNNIILDPLQEKIQVKDLLNKIESENLSYADILFQSRNFSDAQNIVLASALGNLPKIKSQNWNCRHISTYRERLLNDLGTSAAAVSGMHENQNAHEYTILKKGDSIMIITDEDFSKINTTNTKIFKINTINTKKALQIYHKIVEVPSFSHTFHKDNEFKWKYLTDDGKNVANALDYDFTTNHFKKQLNTNELPLQISIHYDEFTKAAELNFHGFFLKEIETTGNKFSSLEKLSLSQFGFRRNFEIPNKKGFMPLLQGTKFGADLSYIWGKLDLKNKPSSKVRGYIANLTFDTNNKKGLNTRLHAGTTQILAGIGETSGIWEAKETNYEILKDTTLGTKISYTIPIEKINLMPYTIIQAKNHVNDLEKYQREIMINEIQAGIKFDAKISNTSKFSFNPYYAERIWEKAVGLNLQIENYLGNLKVNLEKTKSDYEFCPNKARWQLEANVNLGNFTLGANAELLEEFYEDKENYKIETDSQFKIGIKIGYKY